MNLFGKPKIPKAEDPPTIDEARQHVDSMRRHNRMRRRAGNLLTQSGAAPVAARKVTGN